MKTRLSIPEIQAIGERFYRWAEEAFFDADQGIWPDEHPWGTCTYINEVARVLLYENGYESSIIGLPEGMMPEWWRDEHPTGHDWARVESGEDVDLWPSLYGAPGVTYSPLPLAAVQVYAQDEIGYVRRYAVADLKAWRAEA